MKAFSKLVRLLGIIVLAAMPGFADEVWRDFRNAEGAVIRARVVSMTDKQVTIQRADRMEFTVDIAKLSPPDQAFLAEWKTKNVSKSKGPADKGGAKGDDKDVVIGPPPPKFKLDEFYKKHVEIGGLPIVSSDKVNDKALLVARKDIAMMVAKEPRMIDALVKNKVRVSVMAVTELTTDIPEHSDLRPKEQWDQRARGLGATHSRPSSSCAEENLLGLPEDRYKGENILVHEFAHTLHTMAIVDLDPKFDERLKKAYADAMAAGLWKNTYAATDHKEYWAEGVQSWFNLNMEAKLPNGIHNHVNTHKELKEYDPVLYALIAEWLPEP
jgi:hypothetical protein